MTARGGGLAVCLRGWPNRVGSRFNGLPQWGRKKIWVGPHSPPARWKDCPNTRQYKRGSRNLQDSSVQHSRCRIVGFRRLLVDQIIVLCQHRRSSLLSARLAHEICESGEITARMRAHEDSCVQYSRPANQFRRPTDHSGSAHFRIDRRRNPPPQFSVVGIHDARLTRNLAGDRRGINCVPCASPSTQLVFLAEICWPRFSNRTPRRPAVALCVFHFLQLRQHPAIVAEDRRLREPRSPCSSPPTFWPPEGSFSIWGSCSPCRWWSSATVRRSVRRDCGREKVDD